MCNNGGRGPGADLEGVVWGGAHTLVGGTVILGLFVKPIFERPGGGGGHVPPSTPPPDPRLGSEKENLTDPILLEPVTGNKRS